MRENRINTIFGSTNTIHMIGVGGIGMSGIAEVLIHLGFSVTGSDTLESSITEHLQSLGVHIYTDHHRNHVQSQDVVVYSSAIKPDNPEYKQAERLGIKLIRRAEFLGMLLSIWPIRIGVAGTHGKTSTASIIAAALDACGSRPSLFIGGILKDLKTNARMDSKTHVIFEADEYDRTFLALPPTLAIITNVDADHLDIYRDIEDMKKAFLEYANSVPENGSVILCCDDPEARSLLPYIDRPWVAYGTNRHADFHIEKISYNNGSDFTLRYQNKSIGRFHIQQVGLHNVLNATAALVTAYLLHLNISDAGKGIHAFSGVERRFELRHQCDDVLFYDDYAHHPTEITATLKAARIRYENRRIIAIFQPHLYTRTRDFAEGFAQALEIADKVYIVDIYPAREKPIKGVSSTMIVDMMKENSNMPVFYIKKMSDVAKTLIPEILDGDIILTLGAGDIWEVSDALYKEYHAR
ncbi:MAG: UDP-N-acetylmuramate--L-alanine ligase [Candidatus Marinimicrobia bacterium]|nr:UDP-N-acetylmuramate--L-alanine ligase [Candidatus Neomarinimicrobiota bacterium]